MHTRFSLVMAFPEIHVHKFFQKFRWIVRYEEVSLELRWLNSPSTKEGSFQPDASGETFNIIKMIVVVVLIQATLWNHLIVHCHATDNNGELYGFYIIKNEKSFLSSHKFFYCIFPVPSKILSSESSEVLNFKYYHM